MRRKHAAYQKRADARHREIRDYIHRSYIQGKIDAIKREDPLGTSPSAIVQEVIEEARLAYKPL